MLCLIARPCRKILVSKFFRPKLLKRSAFDDFADDLTSEGFVFGLYKDFLGSRFIGIAAAMNAVRVKGERLVLGLALYFFR